MGIAKRLQGSARRPGSRGPIQFGGGGQHSLVFDMFFDRPRVIRSMDSYRRRVLIRQGGYARKVLRTNQRPGGKGGKSSSKGEFPRAQEGSLRRLSVFAYDQGNDTAVVGPVGFSRLPKGYTLSGGQTTIPQLLNEGGVVYYDERVGEKSRAERFGGRGRAKKRAEQSAKPSANGRKRRRGGVARRTRQRRYRIEERPFIRLTQDIVTPKLAEIASQVSIR